MSNSSLISYTKISPNKNSPRNHKIDTITIHCIVGQLSAPTIGDCFISPDRQASCNYGIGTDGKIILVVDEKDRSWCTSSSSNDNRAITIECACDPTHPYAINDKVYKSLIKLCADICKRNGIKKLIWKDDKNLIGQVSKQNMTVHRWFANKACPGDYIFSRLGKIASEVNAKLGTSSTSSNKPKPASNKSFMVKVSIKDLNIRKGPGTNYPKTGDYTGIGAFTIVQTKTGIGSTAGWGLLKSYEKNKDGWISLDFAKKI